MATHMAVASVKSSIDKKLVEWRRNEISDVTQKAKEFADDRKKANNVLEIIAALEAEDDILAEACIIALRDVFSIAIKRGEIWTTKNEQFQNATAEEKYKIWIGERYDEIINKMLDLLMSDRQQNVKRSALQTLLEFVHLEASSTLKRGPKFPDKILMSTIKILLNISRDMKPLMKHFIEFIKYEDFKIHTLRLMLKRLETRSHLQNDVFLKNCFAILEHVEISSDVESHKNNSRYKMSIADKTTAVIEFETMRSLFSSVWLSFLRRKMNNTLHRHVLVILHDKVMPYVEHPLLLTDFLMDSYKVGGSISLLALNGIFILMQKHNLEFPDFYKKLYALFEPGIFHTKYRARFFYLADIFLSSSHLPAYLVAAFVKRLARLSLTAPPHCLKLIITFIRNLLIRHPNLDTMLHNPDGPNQSFPCDPYIMDEPDPVKCKALESSLWELLTLRQHYHPGVSVTASIVEKQLPPTESDISDLLELNISDMIRGEGERKKKETVPVNFERPSGLLFGSGNMSELWSIS